MKVAKAPPILIIHISYLKPEFVRPFVQINNDQNGTENIGNHSCNGDTCYAEVKNSSICHLPSLTFKISLTSSSNRSVHTA